MNPLVIPVIIFVATFTQATSGFGSALISMALLPGLIGTTNATALVALIAIWLEMIILFRYRHAFNLQSVLRLSLASVAGIPFGILALDHVDERVILRVLGIVLLSYSAYALLRLRLPTISNPRWAYAFGFVAGILSGLYNTSGPPVVIYGTCRCWSPAEFRSNLQGFFLINGLVVIAAHAVSQHYTPVVWQSFVAALPGMALGLASAFLLNRAINAALFRQIVLVLLAVLGLRLLLG